MEGMYWGDLRGIIRRAMKPNGCIKYFKSNLGFRDTITICDMNRPRRTGVLSTAMGHVADWERDSIVCNAGWVNGYIPIHDVNGVWNGQTSKWEDWPVRGVRTTLQILINSGAIDMNDEVREVLR